MNNRRAFIKNASVVALSGALLTTKLDAFAEENARKNVKRAMRVAHLTDIHLLATAAPREAFKRVLSAINTMADPPQLIVNSGDSVMDMNNQSKTHILSLWDAWNEVAATNRIPMRSCIGNHDVWYSPAPASATDKTDPLYGKGMILKQLDLPSPYYTFTKNGWKFIALDSINSGPGNIGYILDDQQFTWLETELARTQPDMPVLIFSHIPIITVTAVLYYVQRRSVDQIKYPGYDQHADAKKIKDLFYKYKNVKVALSGHIHYVDTVDYLGVKYHCGGAVSGNWWGGVLDEFAPAYSILDLYEDGSSQYETVFYKWD